LQHNLDVICNADTIIDFGPGGRHAGGAIVVTETPEEVVAYQGSLTGQSLKNYIATHHR
jgi:excinuclease ABC subunit A